jgi:hypothetical protein
MQRTHEQLVMAIIMAAAMDPRYMLKTDGSIMSSCAPVEAKKLGIGAELDNSLNPCLTCGLVVQRAYDFCGPDKDGGCSPWAPSVAPELIRLVAPDLRREEADFEPKRRPEAAKELQCKEAADDPPRCKAGEAGAELLKKMKESGYCAMAAIEAPKKKLGAGELALLTVIAAFRGIHDGPNSHLAAALG